MNIGASREVRRNARHVSFCVLLSLGIFAAGPICARETAQPPSSAVPSKSPVPGLDQYIERGMHDWGIPGLAVAIVKDDKVVYARGFGVRNSETREPVTPRTIFGVGSVTKSFTATSMAMLVDEGKMRWDAPVKDYLPYFQTYDPYVTAVLSPRDLACHRTGIEQANYLQWRPTGRADNIYHPTRADIVRAFKYLGPSEGFREKFSYKNDTWVVAGAVIEALSGRTWDQFVHERIFAPLGMHRSSTSVSETDALDDVSSVHVVTGGKLTPIKLVLADVAGPMGSINSTVLDLAQYVRFHLGQGTFEGSRLLSDASIAELHQPQMIDPTETFIKGTHFTQQVSYALGWWVQDYRGHKLVRHAGEIVGGSANVYYLPEKHLGVVVLANADAMNFLGGIALRAIDGYLGVPAFDWSARALEEEPERLDKEHGPKFKALMAEQEKGRIPDTKPSLPLESYAGTYHHDAYGDLEISVESGALRAKLWTFTGKLAHWNYDTFSFEWDPQHYYLHVYPERQNLVRFGMDEHGIPSRVSFISMGEFRRTAGSPQATAGKTTALPPNRS
jgi:CubicO group peptidase (beta-lactamase class C family)